MVCRTLILAAALGSAALPGAAHAGNTIVDEFLKGFTQGREKAAAADLAAKTELLRSSGGSLGSVPGNGQGWGSGFPERVAPTTGPNRPPTGLTGLTR